MTNKIFELLKGKMKDTSYTDRTLRIQAERLAKKLGSEDQITDEAINECVELLTSFEGQFRHDVSERVKEAEAKFKKNEVAPVQNVGDNNTGNSNEPPAWFTEWQNKFVAERQKELDGLRAERESERKASAQSNFRSDLKKALQERGAKREYAVDVIVSKINYTDGATVDSVISNAIDMYNAECTKIYGDGASPRVSTDQSGKGSNPAMEEYKAKLIAQGKIPSENKE